MESPATTELVPADGLTAFVTRALAACGLPASDAGTVADLMVRADLRGADGHGIARLPQYVRRIRAGGIKLEPKISVLRESGATALVDGDNGMGHLAVRFAADLAIRTAGTHGVSWIGVRNGNHAGPAALYAMMPIEHDMIGIYLAVGNSNQMAPWGGVEKLLSTNPIAIAVPTGGDHPLVFDMATTVVAFGSVTQRVKRGESIPDGWMIDAQGNPLNDPAKVGDGLLLPSGGHKGAGLSLMITILAGVLNGAAAGSGVIDFNADQTSPTNTGQAIIAVDISRFCEPSSFKLAMDAFATELRDSRPLPGTEHVRLPGDRSAELHRQRSALGVPVNPTRRAELDGVADDLGIPRL